MQYDVVVVGGGPAGLAFVRSLAGTGLRIAVVERQERHLVTEPPVDGREIALTHRSVDTLRALGAWSLIDGAEIAPLREARVLNGASPFALSFDAAGTQEDKLGWLVPNHLIRRALFKAVADQAGSELFCGATVSAVRRTGAAFHVDVDHGQTLEARLLVAADSRFSAVRDQLGIAAEINRLGRSMMVCRVSHEREHGGIATEWFDHGQTIAMLPLNGQTVVCGADAALGRDRSVGQA